MKRHQHVLIMTGYNSMTRRIRVYLSRSFGVIYHIFLHFKLHISHNLLQQLGYIA